MEGHYFEKIGLPEESMMHKKLSPGTSAIVSAAKVQRKRTVFSRQFKLDAVLRMREAGCSPAKLAQELGIRRNQLYKWRAALEVSGALANLPVAAPSAVDLLSENARLRSELAKSLEENAILKKFDAYLVQRQH